MECNETLFMDGPRQGENEAERVCEFIDGVYRSESRRVLATLVRLLGDFDRAEEALHDAFATACLPTHGPGWFLRDASRPLTASASAHGSTR